MNIFPHIIKYFKYSIPMTTKYSFMCPGLTTSLLWMFISSAGGTVLKSLLKFLVTSVRKIPRSRGQDYFEAPHTCCQVAFQKHILISPFPASAKSPVILQARHTLAGGGALVHPKAPGSPDNGPLVLPTPSPLPTPASIPGSRLCCVHEVSVQICPAVWHSGLPPRAGL